MFGKYPTRLAEKRLAKESGVTPSLSQQYVNERKAVLAEMDSNECLARFVEVGDDSSDEADPVYDVGLSWTNYLNYSNSGHALGEDDLFSFAGHALGLCLLRNDNIMQRYYRLKRTILSPLPAQENNLQQLLRLVLATCEEASTATLENVKRFLMLSEQTVLSKEDLQHILETTRKEFKKQCITQLPTYLPTIIEWMMLYKYNLQQNSAKTKTVAEALGNTLATLFLDKTPFQASRHDREKAKAALLLLARNHMQDIMDELHFSTKYYSKGRDEAIMLLRDYQSSYPAIVANMRAMLTSCQTHGSVQTMLLSQLKEEDHQQALMDALSEDVASMRRPFTLSRPRSGRIEGRPFDTASGLLRANGAQASLDEKDILRNYFKADKECLRDDILVHFVLMMHRQLPQTVAAFHRVTLGDWYRFDSDNAYAFYANLNLSNRAQNRETVNLQNYALFKKQTVVRSWRILPSLLPQGVLESQDILSSATRKDMVLNTGNYEDVYAAIKRIQDECQVSDQTIATWLREIIQGKLPLLPDRNLDQFGICHKLENIAYLLLGCEVVRNPAMAVINQMLLDLILQDPTWSFEEALTGKRQGVVVGKEAKRMPMAPEGMVAFARALETDYRDYLPHRYVYRGVEDNEGKPDTGNKQTLIMLEARVVRAWMKRQPDAPLEATPLEQLRWLFNKGQAQFSRWLGTNPPQVKTRRKMSLPSSETSLDNGHTKRTRFGNSL